MIYLVLADIHIELRNDAALLEDLNGYLKVAPNGPYADKARQQRDELQQQSRNTRASSANTPAAHP